MARILVVDDEVMVAETVVRLLQREGHDVHVTFSFRDGCARLVNVGSFDLVITDLNLGDGDGFSLLNEAAELQKVDQRRAIIMSGDFPTDFAGQVGELWKKGMRIVPMAKSFDLDTVMACVKCVLAMP